MINMNATAQIICSGIIADDTIMISKALIRKWKIPHGQHITLKFGSFKSYVKVIAAAQSNAVRISQALATQMGLLTGGSSKLTLRLQYKSDPATLVLGPLIGVLISRDYPQNAEKPFGSITLFCRELVEGCKSQGAYVYFFTPNQLGGSMNQIAGWIYDGGWRQAAMPIPDIVNNRLTTRKLENLIGVQQFMSDVKLRHRTKIFNEKFLDKTEVFDALKKDESLTRYLPESHLLRNYATLKMMCSRYNNVFLKPVRGSLGKGIIRLSRADSDNYHAMFATASGTRKQQFSSLSKLYSTLSVKMKTVRYQVQQGLQLIEIAKRPVDFRALVQKNASGKWVITSIVARTASGQHFVSNLARGGTLSTVSAAVTKSNLQAGTGATDASKRLRLAALHIARGIETHIPYHFGELGIDLALDTHGRIWLLEVNSKPSKNENTPLSDRKIRPSVRMMIQYSRYLSGF